jgi:hypothetical protein
VANATTRQVAVIVAFAPAAAAPKVAGLFAEGRVETGSSQALTLPESAVVRAGDNAWAWRVGSGNALKKTAIKLGDRDPRTGLLPVMQGLDPGERVLRNPASTLTEGQTFEWAATRAAAASAAK